VLRHATGHKLPFARDFIPKIRFTYDFNLLFASRAAKLQRCITDAPSDVKELVFCCPPLHLCNRGAALVLQLGLGSLSHLQLQLQSQCHRMPPLVRSCSATVTSHNQVVVTSHQLWMELLLGSAQFAPKGFSSAVILCSCVGVSFEKLSLDDRARRGAARSACAMRCQPPPTRHLHPRPLPKTAAASPQLAAFRTQII